MPIRYLKGDLFQAKSGALAHACNCHGVWGGGIALIFKQKFPNAYIKYRDHCEKYSPDELLGTCLLIPDSNYLIACLFTNEKSNRQEIVSYSQDSVLDMARQLPEDTPIYMPQINAGIFAVPWEETAAGLEKTGVPLNVYTL